MVLSDISIKRPVLATVMSLLVLLLGLISYDRLTVREYPNIDVPVVTVETSYPGASARIMETQVTQILEDSLSGIEGMDYMSSVSRTEKSQITLNFKSDRDPDNAASDVRDRVGRVRALLPDDVDAPVIAKTEADAQPIIWLAFSSDRHTPMEVSHIADKQVKDQLQTVTGVANVMIVGDRRYSMRIWLDPARMAAYEVTTQDVEGALSAQNIEIPAGRIESQEREFTVLAQTDINQPEAFERVILRQDDGYAVRLEDVARIEVAPEEERKIARFKGNSAVAMGVVKQSTANPLDVSDGIRARMDQIQQQLPEGMTVEVAYDSSLFIDRSIDSVFETLLIAGVLVVLVIFAFLRNWRATLIPAVTIPLSLIGAFALMYAWDFSINTLTLLALVLAIGLVVDDAIVMLENIYRHVENDLPPIQAAFKGSKEIAFAVIATSLTLIAVFVPIALSEGRTGKLFAEFALTLAATVLVSTFIALTLSPMMASRMLHHEKRHSALFNLIEGWLQALTNGYHALLEKVLSSRLLIIMILLASFGGTAFMFSKLPQELSPTEDRGTIMTFSIAPDGASVSYVDRYVRQIEQQLEQIPEQDRYFAIVGFPTSTNAMSFTGLDDWSERKRSQMEIVEELTPKLFAGVTGLMTFAMNPPSLGESIGSYPVEFVIKKQGDFDALQQINNQMLAKIRENPGFRQPDSDLKLNKPELRLQVNRDKVSDAGLDINVVGRTLETFMAGRQVTRFKKEGDQYDVIVQIEDRERRTPDDLTDIYLRNPQGQMIQLANLVTVEEAVAPRELNHFDKVKAATLKAQLAPGYSLDEALAFLETSLKEVDPQATFDYTGPAREFKSSSASLQISFALALTFIFLVLAAQFESFKNPLIIMLSVPPAMLGAMLALSLTGNSISIYSQIGLITLIGLISKHGILIVEFANQLQDQGYKVRDAVVEAASLRLRPILMTTAATVLGALPLALASGAGAESQSQIGWVIVGGMTSGTLLTLFVVPSVYSYFGKRNFKNVQPDPELMRAEGPAQS